jgi:DNA-binding LytR/AlgR family response regulator
MKVLIIEDEFLIALSIQNALQKHDHNVCTIASNYTEAVSILENESPDIAILDLKLEGNKSGTDIAEKINETFKIPFIFLTSVTDQTLLNSLKYLNPSGIIIKPFNEHELIASLNLALFQYSKSDDSSTKKYIFIKQKSEYSKIDLDQITYIKSQDVNILIHLKNHESLKTRTTLESFETQLNHDFIRVHRSYIINIKAIKKVFKEHLLISKDIIPIGNKYKSKTLNILNIK